MLRTVLQARTILVFVFALAAESALAQSVGTAFTYQGRLTDSGNPASGSYDLQFTLFDAAIGGAQVGLTLTRDDLAVIDGVFNVSLDFGAVFNGTKRWLGIAVRPGASSGSYTELSPRQELTPIPYAVFSSMVPWSGITGKPAGFADDVDNDSGGDITSVATPAGSGLTGGASSGDVTLGVNFGGSGSSSSVSRSDHNHVGQTWGGNFSATFAFRSINTGGPSGFTDGVWGQSDSPGNARGIVGYATAASGQNYGVWGQSDSTSGLGLFGIATAGSGAAHGVKGQTASPNGLGVYGQATAVSGTATGVQGETSSATGRGVYGHATSTASGSTYGVFGQSDAANDGRGVGGGGVFGVFGTGSRSGTYGTDTSPSFNGAGIWGQSVSTNNGAGVFGQALGTSGVNYGVYAQTLSPSGYGGYFVGPVHVTGTLTKGGGAFKIDHPLDPENKYLYHSFVESPDMKNIYDGIVVTNADGFATVDLPDWFQAVNGNFRYQLTVIGQFAQAIVAREIDNNQFTIQTSLPNVRVSWQVTGIRHDVYAERHRIPVEEDKTPEERGTFLYPEEHGRSREQGVAARRGPAVTAPRTTEPRF